MKILIVEDEFLIAEDLKLTIEGLGYDVVGPAASCVAALLLIEGELPNLALIDTRLGSENTESVVADCLARDIAMIITSGHGQSELPPYCAGLPYLSKPFSPDQAGRRRALGATGLAPVREPQRDRHGHQNHDYEPPNERKHKFHRSAFHGVERGSIRSAPMTGT